MTVREVANRIGIQENSVTTIIREIAPNYLKPRIGIDIQKSVLKKYIRRLYLNRTRVTHLRLTTPEKYIRAVEGLFDEYCRRGNK
jgi:hypothetical protein